MYFSSALSQEFLTVRQDCFVYTCTNDTSSFAHVIEYDFQRKDVVVLQGWWLEDPGARRRGDEWHIPIDNTIKTGTICRDAG